MKKNAKCALPTPTSLTNSWLINVHIYGKHEHFTSSLIKYKRGIFQGDSLSCNLFILCMNPLSHLLNKLKGYNIGKPQSKGTNITHLFFVDDLKLYAANMNSMKLLLDLVTKFSNDIGMSFGLSKCAYSKVERGRLSKCDENLVMNNLSIQPIKEGETYKYLGQDENLSYDGPVNKDRVRKEYIKRTRKIWSSELSGYNKYIAHNAFAIPIITPTFGILNWTIEDLKQIDIKTRKNLTMSGNFHRNGDIDKLYIPRKLGGRGLRSLITAFECRIISIKFHLKQNKKRNKYLYEVVQHEEENVIRVAEELLMRANLNMVDQTEHRHASQEYLKYSNEQRLKCYKSKPMHAYIQNKIENEEQIDKNITKSWTADKYITSHFEGYAFAIHEQEITTKDLTYRRDRKAGENTTCK